MSNEEVQQEVAAGSVPAQEAATESVPEKTFVYTIEALKEFKESPLSKVVPESLKAAPCFHLVPSAEPVAVIPPKRPAPKQHEKKDPSQSAAEKQVRELQEKIVQETAKAQFNKHSVYSNPVSTSNYSNKPGKGQNKHEDADDVDSYFASASNVSLTPPKPTPASAVPESKLIGNWISPSLIQQYRVSPIKVMAGYPQPSISHLIGPTSLAHIIPVVSADTSAVPAAKSTLSANAAPFVSQRHPVTVQQKLFADPVRGIDVEKTIREQLAKKAAEPAFTLKSEGKGIDIGQLQKMLSNGKA